MSHVRNRQDLAISDSLAAARDPIKSESTSYLAPQLRFEINSQGGTAEYWPLDVTREAHVANIFRNIRDRFGRIDCLVNNARIAGANKPTDQVTEEEWDKVMAVNLKGVFLCIRHVIPYLKEHGGSIVNLSSIYGLAGAADVPVYHAAKGGVRLMTKDDALQYASYGIRINSVHPGFVQTPMVEQLGSNMPGGSSGFRKALDAKHPIGHVGEPDDIGWGIVYLASDESKFIAGSELVIDGGYTAQ